MRKTHRILMIGALSAVLTVGGALAASATTSAISGTTTSATWVNYATVRRTTQSTVSFTPTDLLYQGGNVNSLQLRLLNENGGVLSSSKTWTSKINQTIMTGLSINYPFRMSACCYYSGSGGDSGWAGNLTY
ncbi:MAG: hypothetical protein LBB54_00755 [Cellulomonadaceae bacterium]|nr:hypothetical protein [Cellulomonadaceae bacterium]